METPSLPDPLTWTVDYLRDARTTLREFGAESQAVCLDRVIALAESALRLNEGELLSATAAAAISGYTPGHLGRMSAAGKLTNLGTKNRPRFRRAELPRKPRSSGALTEEHGKEICRDIVRKLQKAG